MKTLLTIHEINEPVDELNPAIQYALDNNAHLNVVALGVLPTVTIAASPGVPAYYVQDSHNEVIQEGKKSVAEIEAHLAEKGVAGSVSLEFRDPILVEKAISGHAYFSDAAIFTKGKLLGSGGKARSFNGALLASGRPVLTIDPKEPMASPVRKIAFAWNGDVGASKAMHHCLAYFCDLTDVSVVVVDPDEYETGPNPGDDVASFLARRGLSVQVERLPGRQRDPIEVVLEHANDIDADAVVMGAFGRSRFSDWLLGSSTRYAIEHAKTPLFLAH